MSVRSFKQIFDKFCALFPELAKGVGTWKGIRFVWKNIRIQMKDGNELVFTYYNEHQWQLTCNPSETGG